MPRLSRVLLTLALALPAAACGSSTSPAATTPLETSAIDYCKADPRGCVN